MHMHYFFKETKTFICSSVFVPDGKALIILNRGKEHNRTDSVSQWLRAMKVIEGEIPAAVIQRYWSDSRVKRGDGGFALHKWAGWT